MAAGRVAPRRDLRPRVQPRQERAQRTVARLLLVAGALLEEVGLEAFNTNLLAERAGVRVRTVYRYFPNKQAVIVALAQGMTAEWSRWLDGFAAVRDHRVGIRRAWTLLMRRSHEGVRRLPGGSAVRRAMQASPELRAIDQADNERLSAQLAAALRARGARLSPRRAQVVARTLIETATTVLDFAVLHGGAAARAHLTELARMHVRYLDGILANEPGEAAH